MFSVLETKASFPQLRSISVKTTIKRCYLIIATKFYVLSYI